MKEDENPYNGINHNVLTLFKYINCKGSHVIVI